MLGQTTGMSSPKANKEKSSYKHMSANTEVFDVQPQLSSEINPLDFYLRGKLKRLV
jgi:hypothetical protein